MLYLGIPFFPSPYLTPTGTPVHLHQYITQKPQIHLAVSSNPSLPSHIHYMRLDPLFPIDFFRSPFTKLLAHMRNSFRRILRVIMVLVLFQDSLFLANCIRQSGNFSGDCQIPIDVTAEVHRSSSTYVTIGLPRSTPPSNKMYDNSVSDRCPLGPSHPGFLKLDLCRSNQS